MATVTFYISEDKLNALMQKYPKTGLKEMWNEFVKLKLEEKT